MRAPKLLHLARPAAHVAAEVLAAGKVVALYPSGLSDRVSDRLCAPRFPRPTDRRLPVLLLHGIFHNQSWAVRLERMLAEEGYTCWSVNYRTVGCTVDDAAAQVAGYVRALAARHGVDRVHVVAHSLGGLVLRAAAARHGIGDMLAAAVTIGSPHGGSPLALRPARSLPGVGALIGQVATGSAFLAQLDRDCAQIRSGQWTSIYSLSDQIVPGHRGRLNHPALAARNIVVSGIGHAGLMFHRRVTGPVLAALAAADRLPDLVETAPASSPADERFAATPARVPCLV